MKNPIDDLRQFDLATPVATRGGEWECDFPNWPAVYEYSELIIERLPNKASESEISDLIYAIARDNECEVIANKVSKKKSAAEYLLKQCQSSKESDAKWQLCCEYCKTGNWSLEIEQIFYELYFDKSYYTQRRILMELAKKQSGYTIELAELSWQTYDEYQRISALHALSDFGYKGISEYISVAKKSNSQHLINAAIEIENRKSDVIGSKEEK